jgi:peroxiredoxin
LLSDVDRVVGRAYGVERFPDEPNPQYPKRITFLIDPDGVIARVYEVTDAGAHPAVVLEDLGHLAHPA